LAREESSRTSSMEKEKLCKLKKKELPTRGNRFSGGDRQFEMGEGFWSRGETRS